MTALTSSLVRSLTYLAGLPAHSWPEGISLPGATTVPGAKMLWVSTRDPSIKIDLSPMMHSCSTVVDLSTQDCPTVTYRPMFVAADSPVGLVLQYQQYQYILNLDLPKRIANLQADIWPTRGILLQCQIPARHAFLLSVPGTVDRPRTSKHSLQLDLVHKVINYKGAHLAAWITVLSWILENAPTLMLFKSPRSTHPYQMLTCTPEHDRFLVPILRTPN